MNEELFITHSNRNLERKILIFGFEIFDLLVLATTLSVLNLVFKGVSFQVPIVWGLTLILAGILYLTKRNKPENFLLYKFRFWLAPPIYFATGFDLKQMPYLKK